MKRMISGLLVIVAATFAFCACSGGAPKEKDMSAYLLVYFTDPTHDIFFETSHDGYTFTAVNDGKPVISGRGIAEQKGVRDPHIYRGPDGAFYMAMTDLHIYAQREGFRETLWERDESYGWGNNRGLVLMKSEDLINWTSNEVRIDKAFPEDFGEIGCAWAPETIYDAKEGKMMVYFTIRKTASDRTKLYYAYTNDEFTEFVSKPELLFEYPDSTIQVLDADITALPDGRFMMAYCAQENPGGIKIAFSDRINGGYVYQDEQVDFEPKACEAPNVWKRIGEDKWVLMYDVFSIQPHNFGFAETSDFKTFTDLGHFGEGKMQATNFVSPKHGAVIQITAEEAARVESYTGWGK